MEIEFKSWGKLIPDEVGEIIKLRYSDGFSPKNLVELIVQFPPEQYLWCILNDY